MTSTQNRPIVRDYALVSLGALIFITLLLVQLGLGWWSALPLLVGSGCVLARWAVGPALVLLLLVFLQVMRNWLTGMPRWYPRPHEPISDLLLAVSVLIYIAAHMRLLSLERHTVPPDARQGRKPPGGRVLGRWLLPREATRRASPLVAPGEISRLLATAPVFGLVASLLWLRLAVDTPPEWLDLPPQLWHLFVIVWVLALALAGAYALLSWLGRTQASPEESLLFLEDQLWAATRGEQRRINRWIVWARLRRQRKEETR